MSDTTSGRSLVEPPQASNGRSAPNPMLDLAGEVAELAELLADLVQLAGRRAVFPGHWEQIAEQAMEHSSVRAALAAGLS
ncbi:MAG TPA: hypothetical protein VF003_18790 [Pseudonocardiaceae bacterium]